MAISSYEAAVSNFIRYAQTPRIREFISRSNNVTAVDHLAGAFRESTRKEATEKKARFSEQQLRDTVERYLRDFKDHRFSSGKTYSDLLTEAVRQAMGSPAMSGVLIREVPIRAAKEYTLIAKENGKIEITEPAVNITEKVVYPSDEIEREYSTKGNTLNYGNVGRTKRFVAPKLRNARLDDVTQRLARVPEIRRDRSDLTQKLYLRDITGESEVTKKLTAVMPQGLVQYPTLEARATESFDAISNIGIFSLKRYKGFTDRDIEIFGDLIKNADETGNINANDVTKFLVRKCDELRRVYGSDVKSFGKAVRAMFGVAADTPYAVQLKDKAVKIMEHLHKLIAKKSGHDLDQLRGAEIDSAKEVDLDTARYLVTYDAAEAFVAKAMRQEKKLQEDKKRKI